MGEIRVDKTIKTYIGLRINAKDTAEGVLKTLDKNPHVETIELYARGKAISVAVDVSEIIKRKLDINKSDIQTKTTEVMNKNERLVDTSEIIITLPCQKTK